MSIRIGSKYRYMTQKVHVVAIVIDVTDPIIVFKRWHKFRWDYQALPNWLFVHFAVPCK